MLTRRQLLELGAAAWLTALLGSARSAQAAGMDPTAPGYLRRASWVPLTGATVAVAGVTLRLAQVADLPHLAGRDDAFRLELTGPAGAFPGGTRQFRHPGLGSFELFVSPVDAPVGAIQPYEVVVDRSIRLSGSVPAAPPPPAHTAPHHRPHKRRHHVRRHARRLHRRR